MIPEPPSVLAEHDVAALLEAAGLGPRFHLESLCGGANNRVFRVRCDSEVALLKVYYRAPDDLRDRLGAEWAFLRFAWDRGLRCVPRPLTCDQDHGLGLYEFLEGRPLAAAEVQASHVQEAVSFFAELNRYKSHPLAGELPQAAESCFTLGEHLACVDRRVVPLVQLEVTTPLEREAAEWVCRDLVPAWSRVAEQVRTVSRSWGLAVGVPVASADRCISPSDFGFHNAILTPEGHLRFFDFEYAGWDDPAKMVCDFLCQPAVPIPDACRDGFAQAAVSELGDPARHLRRIALLLPVYTVKWCCIMMNEFLPAGGRRRRFAQSDQDQDQRKREQLRKARAALAKMEVEEIR